MRDIFLIIVILLNSSLAVFAQEINKVDAEGKKQGQWKKYYPSNDGLFYEGQFKDDKPYGVFMHYYETGQPKSMTNYDDEIVRSMVFYTNGKLMASGNFIEQKKDSVWTYFEKAGWLSMRESYKDGMKEGLSISYYPDSSIAVKQTYSKDLEIGAYVKYYPNGNKEAEANYLGGNFNGDYTYYFEDGKKMQQGEYINGKRNGTWLFFNANASLKNVVYYKNGSVFREDYKNGEFKVFYDSGLLRSVYKYKDGKKDGPFIEYFDNGKRVLVPLEKESTYDPDDFKEVIEGQQIKHKGIYRNDVLVGEELQFEENGKLIKKEDHSK